MIDALSMGSRAAGIIDSQSGVVKVYSIYRHAVNFICSDDYLITLLDDCRGRGSQIINISSQNLAYLISSLKNTKDSFNIKSFINFYKAQIVNFTPFEQSDRIQYNFLKKNVSLCREYAVKHGALSVFSYPIDGKGTIYSKYIRTGLYMLEDAYLNKDRDKMVYAFDNFTGLGPGLTPSGDDFICGFFAVLFYFSTFTGLDIGEVKDMGAGVVKRAKDKTTLVGYNMLRSCLRGEMFEYVHDLMNSMLKRSNNNLLDKLNRVLQTGSTSGFDMVYGMLHAFKMIDMERKLSMKQEG